MLFQLLSGPGWQAKKKKSNTIPCLGQVLICLGQRQVKLHTLFRTARPKNHNLSSGTSPYSPNKGVPPPPPPRDRGPKAINSFFRKSSWFGRKSSLQDRTKVFFSYIISKMFSGMSFLWIRSKRQSQRYLFRARNDLSGTKDNAGLLKQQQITWCLSFFYFVISYTGEKQP